MTQRYKELNGYYIDLISKTDNLREAYEIAERIFRRKHGRRAYKNYSSFTTQRSKYLNRKR